MIFFNYIYASVYAVSFENLPFERKSKATSYTALALSIACGGIITSIITIYYFIQINIISEIFKFMTILITIICYWLINVFYDQNERYINVYSEYKKTHKVLTMTKGFFITFLIMLICYLPIYVLLFITK